MNTKIKWWWRKWLENWKHHDESCHVLDYSHSQWLLSSVSPEKCLQQVQHGLLPNRVLSISIGAHLQNTSVDSGPTGIKSLTLSCCQVLTVIIMYLYCGCTVQTRGYNWHQQAIKLKPSHKTCCNWAPNGSEIMKCSLTKRLLSTIQSLKLKIHHLDTEDFREHLTF